MSPTSSSFRLRPQFSLRGLLLLMLFVGAGLVVYRWPWEVEEKLTTGEIRRTQYRRAWNGKAVKHGQEVSGDLAAVGGSECWYEDGDLRLKRTWTNGVVDSENHYLNGQLHGLSWDTRNEEGIHDNRGEYRHNQKHGRWTWEI